MFEILHLQTRDSLRDGMREFILNDLLPWLRLLGLSLGDRVPDENMIRHFRNRLTENGLIDYLVQVYDEYSQEIGCVYMPIQIADVYIVSPTRQQQHGGRERNYQGWEIGAGDAVG